MLFALCAYLNFAINTVNKSNTLTKGNLIKERKKPRTKLKVQLLVKLNG